MDRIRIIISLIIFSMLFSAKIDEYHGVGQEFSSGPAPGVSAGRIGGIGQFGYPSDPMADRAQGFLLKGKVKNAVVNYGEFIEWDFFPNGLWGEYSYLADVAMVAGIKGHEYSSNFSWSKSDMEEYEESWYDQYGQNLSVWCSQDLYSDPDAGWELNINELTANDTSYASWPTELPPRVNGRYIGMVFETENDRGKVGIRKNQISDFTGYNQWAFDFATGDGEGGAYSRVCICTRSESISDIDPNKSNAMIGAIYPWALRPSLKERKDEFDLYEYGVDGEVWTSDDDYIFYGATSQESWLTRWNPASNTDWQATSKAKENTHGLEYDSGDIFADTPFSDQGDTYPLLAHSSYSQTWPKKLDLETGETNSFWPGWYAQEFNEGLPGCDGDRKNDACWEQVPGRFTSDNDVYMEFDDRWAHRGNIVNSNNEYEQTGYPLGLKVKSTAHSYGVSFAEDIMFVTVWVLNESHDMVMPDGTKLNDAKGFSYEDLTLGFYMDADVLTADLSGNFSVHTNNEDYMEYVDCKTSQDYYPGGCPVINGEELRVSIAVIGDWDGQSNSAFGYSMDPAAVDGSDFGLVAVQMLDSPLATENVDLNQDGIPDIYTGEKLKMTDWHWFDWYNRPGVVYRESGSGCCAGDPGKDQARNKEEIQYKIMAGDTTNLSDDEKSWFFHANPDLDDLDPAFNPHFDNVEDLRETQFFIEEPLGLDCVMEMTCGPFDLAVQDSVPFSFCVIFGENMEDLLANAEFAQVMYNAKYQGFTAPTTPTVDTEVADQEVKLYWDMKADSSRDVVTGYYDFEGYKIYKSIDGGLTWGADSSKVMNNAGVQVGWRPIEQFDLSYTEDYYHCVKSPQIGGDCGADDNYRGMDVQGIDPLAPWFSLGENTGMPSEHDTDENSGIDCVELDNGLTDCRYYYIDKDVMNGVEYTYSVVSYDMGIPDSTYADANPDGWARPNGYQNIESAKGTTTLDQNFVTVIPGAQNTGDDCNEVRVIPNPYFGRSELNESEYKRRMSFMDLPEKYKLSIYTVTGEHVWTQDEAHQDAGDGMAFWDLRSVNNQEVSPGLYIYTLETMKNSKSTCKHIGKFAIVR